MADSAPAFQAVKDEFEAQLANAQDAIPMWEGKVDQAMIRLAVWKELGDKTRIQQAEHELLNHQLELKQAQDNAAQLQKALRVLARLAKAQSRIT